MQPVLASARQESLRWIRKHWKVMSLSSVDILHRLPERGISMQQGETCCALLQISSNSGTSVTDTTVGVSTDDMRFIQSHHPG